MADAIWDRIGDFAKLAPSPHNTQPFRIVPRGESVADLVAVRDRLLPREDHGNLYMACAFGMFVEALESAGLVVGCGLAVDVEPDVDVARLHLGDARVRLGRLRLSDAGPVAPGGSRVTAPGGGREQIVEAFELRRTSRLPYQDRAVSAGALAAMTAAGAELGHRFLSYDDADTVREVLRLNTDAVIDNLQLDDEREEIRGWYRYGHTPPFGDGLWQHPMNQPAWELRSAFATPYLYTLPAFRQFARYRYLRTQRGTRHVGLLCGDFAAWPDLLRAGRMLMRFWLAMAAHDVYMQPMGSMLTNAGYARTIAERFRVNDCWLVFRFGYSDVPPRAPRLASIVEHE